jgi:hypothetical protein
MEQMEQDDVPLAGKECWGWGRAADLASFQIGQQRTVIDDKGKTKTVGQFALHIQCPWRIVQGEKLIVASGDLYYKPDESAPGSDFNWEPLGANRRDINLDRLFAAGEPLVIRDFRLGCAGFLRIELTKSFCIEIFPDASVDLEHWRLFQPYTDSPHTVARGGSVKTETG